MRNEERYSPYRAMADFRHQIRKFLRFSESAAKAVGLAPKQHQALLAIKGLEPDVRPTIRALAVRMQVRHHTMVELVDRLEARSLVRRRRGTEDRREVLVSVTAHGEKLLHRVFSRNCDEIRSRAPALLKTLRQICRSAVGQADRPAARPGRRSATRRSGAGRPRRAGRPGRSGRRPARRRQ